MRLILAEKSDQARVIAMYLSNTASATLRQDQHGAYLVGNDVVVAAEGHLFEDFMPEDYNPRYKERRVEDLPIIPERFQKKASERKSAVAALAAIKKYVGKAERVLHACDYDREGQLIGDEIFHHFEVPTRLIDRLPITGYDTTTMTAAFAGIHPNATMQSYSIAALVRSRADWLWGMNLSRIYGIEAEKHGYREGVPIGRVISPTLDILARREREIAAFIPVKHYTLKVALNTESGPVAADWVRPAWMEDGFDDDGRLVRRPVAEGIQQRLESAGVARVLTVTPTERHSAPPLPFDLPTLQVEGNRLWRYTAKQIATAAQRLYDRHFVISYPRADSRYYHSGQHAAGPAILKAIKTNMPSLTAFADGANPTLRSAAFDDEKVAVGKISHHAIAPLVTLVDMNRLSNIERDVYELICRYYIAQFYPEAIAEGRVVELTVDSRVPYTVPGEIRAKDLLRMSASSVTTVGWRPVLDKNETGVDKSILTLEPGDQLPIRFVLVEPAETKAPKRFTDGTLIRALNDVGVFIDLPELREQIGKGARLGTASTQSDTLERLVSKKLIERDGEGRLRPTTAGMAIADALPKALKGPALTAMWERELDEIANGKRKGADWLAAQVAVIVEILKDPVVISFAQWIVERKKRTKKGESDSAASGEMSGRRMGAA